MASAWPTAVLTDLTTDVLLKVPGDQLPTTMADTAPAPFDPSVAPRDASTISFYSLTGTPHFTGVEFDAISSGNAIIKDPVDGVPIFPNAWMSITVSIANVGTIEPLSGPFEAARQSGRQVGSELVSYAFNASRGLDGSLLGIPMLEATRTQLGFEEDSMDDIQGLDYGMGVRSFNVAGLASRLFPRTDVLYFSVTREFATANMSLGFAYSYAPGSSGGLTLVAPNATDLYLSTFDGSNWGVPRVFLPGDLLGFDRATDNLDALDVDSERFNIIYSGQGATPYEGLTGPTSQLMIAEFARDNYDNAVPHSSPTRPPSPLRDQTGSGSTIRVTEGVGTSVGDLPDATEVDGICVIEPELGLVLPLVGIPKTGGAGYGKDMGISMVRSAHMLANASGSRLIIQATGWGEAVPQDCWAQLWRRRSGSPANQWAVVASERRRRSEGQLTFDFSVPDSQNERCVYEIQLRDSVTNVLLERTGRCHILD